VKIFVIDKADRSSGSNEISFITLTDREVFGIVKDLTESPIEAAKVQISEILYTYTSASGYYTIKGIPDAGIYTINSSKSGYITKQDTVQVNLTGKVNKDFYLTHLPQNTGSVSTPFPLNNPNNIILYNNYAYVTNYTSGVISKVELSSQTIIDELVVGPHPSMMAINENDNTLYVTHPLDNQYSVIDLNLFTKLKEDTTRFSPMGIAFNTNFSKFYIANNNSNSVDVYNSLNDSLINSITLGNGPNNIVSVPSKDYLIVTNSNDNTISIINSDSDSEIKVLQVGTRPVSVACDQQGQYAIISNTVSNNISVLNLNSLEVISTISTATYPSGVAIHRDEVYGELAYISSYSESIVRIFDFTTMSLVKDSGTDLPVNISTSNYPIALGVNKTGEVIYVVCDVNNQVNIISY
jgi:YVTN family beta-propeller protein